MAKKDYTSEPWWNSLTKEEKKAILQQCPNGEIKEGKPKKKKKKFKYYDLFGYG